MVWELTVSLARGRQMDPADFAKQTRKVDPC
jgi:hypothetical protein